MGMIIKELIKLILTTIFFPFIVVFLLIVTFIIIHEAFWKSIEGQTEHQ